MEQSSVTMEGAAVLITQPELPLLNGMYRNHHHPPIFPLDMVCGWLTVTAKVNKAKVLPWPVHAAGTWTGR